CRASCPGRTSHENFSRNFWTNRNRWNDHDSKAFYGWIGRCRDWRRHLLVSFAKANRRVTRTTNIAEPANCANESRTRRRKKSIGGRTTGKRTETKQSG